VNNDRSRKKKTQDDKKCIKQKQGYALEVSRVTAHFSFLGKGTPVESAFSRGSGYQT